MTSSPSPLWGEGSCKWLFPRREVFRLDILQRARAGNLHHAGKAVAQILEYALRALAAAERQPVEQRPSAGDRLGPECERLEHVAAAPDAAIKDDRYVVLHRVGNARQYRQRGLDAIEDPPAVVRDINGVHVVFDCECR